MFFDPETQAMLDARMAAPGWSPPTPLLQASDEVGIIIKVIPRDGTTTGVGGHVDFYVPSGVTVVDVAYMVPDGLGGFVKADMKGQSPIAVGAGPVGAKTTTQLQGMTTVYNSAASGLSSTAVVTATGLHMGTIAGVYGDTGIFYSTDPDTAYGSWQNQEGSVGSNTTANGCGSLAYNPTVLGKTLVNNSGDTVVPCNKWDAEQLMAWGVKGGTYGATAPIVDYGDGRGNAPWGFASGVAGPQSGYAWMFDWDEWRTSGKTAADMQAAMSTDEIGPWNRIRYGGDQVSFDQPGSLSTVIGYASKDAGNLGYNLSSATPLPANTNAIRWAVGQLTAFRPEYVWVKVKVADPAAVTNPTGCPVFKGDTFGGDAGGTDSGKDHLWRYYEPTETTMNGCLAIGKPATREFVKVGETFQYNIDVYNVLGVTLTNVVVKDLLPSGVAFLSASPAPTTTALPNLTWNVGTLLPGQKFQATVTVKATGTGYLDNQLTVTSTEVPTQTVLETTESGLYPYLVPTKTVSPTGIAPGGAVRYTLLVRNIGTGPTGNPVTLRDYLPAGFMYDPSFTPTAIVNGAAITPSAPATETREPVFTVPAAIQGGQQLTLVFQAKADPSVVPGPYCNSYSVTQNGVPITTGSAACVSVAGGKIGDTIYRDWNGDGSQGAGEEGIQGVTVTLYDSTGSNLLATAITDANGHYYFPGLQPGTYVVKVNGGTTLPGTTQTGDPDGTANNMTTVTLTENQQWLTADFGYRPTGTATIGDKVFEDIANDGVFTAGDMGIPNVTVWLYEDTNGDGAITQGVDALVATTTSNSSGDYLFSNLAGGYDYLVKVDKADPDIQTYFNTKYDPDPVPYQLSTAETTASPDLSGSDLDNDFGFWRMLPASIGDQLFVDANKNGVYDAGEAPLAGVTVTLYRDGQPFRTTVSAADGTYLFDNLGPGN